MKNFHCVKILEFAEQETEDRQDRCQIQSERSNLKKINDYEKVGNRNCILLVILVFVHIAFFGG